MMINSANINFWQMQHREEDQVKAFRRTEEVTIERWYYTKPDFIPDKDGNIVLITKKSFGPLEVYEWGIDSNKNAYERYKWLENDFYEDESYCQNIEREKLLEQIHSVISVFRNNELPEWSDLYEKIIKRLNSDQMV
ncbi:MAG: hypothetical protein K2N44_04145 [Lachnospiraceae bacterium]|nr:hypothetical protein [Lachnospiraceae bacterium]